MLYGEENKISTSLHLLLPPSLPPLLLRLQELEPFEPDQTNVCIHIHISIFSCIRYIYADRYIKHRKYLKWNYTVIFTPRVITLPKRVSLCSEDDSGFFIHILPAFSQQIKTPTLMTSFLEGLPTYLTNCGIGIILHRK